MFCQFIIHCFCNFTDTLSVRSVMLQSVAEVSEEQISQTMNLVITV